jgi:uncharacterized membrane-anchored protein
MRTGFMIGAAVLQVLGLGYMAGERELVLRTGRVVYLRTAPVDPRDAFRGDYVRLSYEIGQVPRQCLRDGLVRSDAGHKPLPSDTRVYAVLTPDADGVARLDTLTNRRPGDGLFIRGRTERYWGEMHSLPVRYGIEAFFVQQDQGKIIEQGRQRGDVQVPMEVAVAVGRGGLAVLKDFRWSPLGTGLRLDTATNRQIRAATVVLMNVSSRELAIVDLPGGRSLRLEPDERRAWGEHGWTWVGATAAVPAVAEADVHVLKPGETFPIRVDLTSPDWFVFKPDAKPAPLNDLRPWEAMFRLVYCPPSADACRSLGHSGLIWHGELPSRAFGGGRVD